MIADLSGVAPPRLGAGSGISLAVCRVMAVVWPSSARYYLGAVTPEVSVVVTSYRTPAPLLDASLRSALDQRDVEAEVVLVVDGEADPGSRAVVETHAGSRLTVIEPGRVGRGRALNAGIERAGSRIIAIQDADDLSHAQRLRRQLDVLERRDDIDLLATVARSTHAAGEAADWELGEPTPPRLIGDELLFRNVLVHSSIAMRRTAFDRAGGYAVGRTRHFDYDLYLRMRATGATIAELGDPLVLRHRHAEQGFERDDAIGDRVWQAYRLQVGATRARSPLSRAGAVARISVRQAGHLSRVLLDRRRAAGSPAAHDTGVAR